MTGSESGSGPFRAGWVPAWDPQRVAAPGAVMSPNFYRNSRDITRGGERPRPRSAPLSRSPPSLPLLSAAGPQPGPFPRRPARPIHKLLPPPSSSFTPSPSRARPRSRAPPAIHTARPAPFISTAPAPGRAAPSRIEPPGPALGARSPALRPPGTGSGPGGREGRRAPGAASGLPPHSPPRARRRHPPASSCWTARAGIPRTAPRPFPAAAPTARDSVSSGALGPSAWGRAKSSRRARNAGVTF